MLTSSIAEAATPAGYTIDLGVPDGLGIGIVGKPIVDWLRLGTAITYNGLAPGFRVSGSLDFFRGTVVPTLTLNLGSTLNGKVPGLNDSPSISYSYADLHLGLEAGPQDRWRLFLHAGPSFVAFRAFNYNQFIADKDRSVFVSDPHGTAFIFPAISIGWIKYFQ